MGKEPRNGRAAREGRPGTTDLTIRPSRTVQVIAACAIAGVLSACTQLSGPGSVANGRSDADLRAAHTGETSALARPGETARTAGSGIPPGRQGAGESDGSVGRALPKPEIYRGSGAFVRDVSRADVFVNPGGDVTLNFINADIREVINGLLGDTLKVNYIVDPAVQGNVTVRTSDPLSRNALVPVLENILALNNAALVIDDRLYRVVPVDAAAGLSRPKVVTAASRIQPGYGIHIVPLRYVSADAVREILQGFVNPGQSLRIDQARNLLIFTGRGSEAEDLLAMVRVFDVDWMAGMSFGLFPVEVANLEALISELEAVFSQQDQGPLAGGIRFVPVERLNAVLAISPRPQFLDRVGTWISRLDRGIEGAGRRIFVYYVQNGRAPDLAAVLAQVFRTGRGSGAVGAISTVVPGLRPVEIRSNPPASVAPPGTAGAGTSARVPADAPIVLDRPGGGRDSGAVGVLGQQAGDIRIIPDERNNALLVMATPEEYGLIEATLKKLDILPLQVLIEVTIADITLNDELRFGLQWFLSGGDVEARFSTLSSGAVNPAFPGFSFLFAGNDARVVLNALSEITDVNVVSSPMLMVLDNESARLQVGDQVPVATQSAVSVDDPSAPIVNSIELLDTGVILEITPHVNASGLIELDVVQEVSSVVETQTSDIDSPTIQQRKIESTVAVQSGETVALGGLIQDDVDNATTGVPLLSEIPVLGYLFKNTREVTARRELLVMITPRIVRDAREARDVTEELRRRLGKLRPLFERSHPGGAW